MGKPHRCNNLLDFRPQFIDRSHFMPPSFNAELLNHNPLHRIAERTHIRVGMHNGDIDKSLPEESHVATS
jgi:hypothetical protein